jgi:Mg-chelatase subunit ChlD
VIKRIIHLVGLVFTLGPLFFISAQAKEKSPLDAIVIMDSSGSMKYTDPKQLRKPAAKLFINLLGKEDKLSVVSFSSKGWPIRIGKSKTFLTQLKTEKIKDSALKATDRISHKGIHTNIHAALEKGIELVKQNKQQNRDPIIVLMSDGKMDVGNAATSQTLREKTINDLIPQLKQNNIKVYSIAFTQQSDQQLLQQVAEETDGRYALAESDDVLHKVFAKIFEQSKEPNMLPLTENKFMVDSSIEEITIIANKKDDKSKIFLESPKGKRISSKEKNKKMKWFVSSSFDMITMTKPEEGEWKILFSDNGNKAYIVANMQLRSDFKYNAESFYPELTINTWLTKDNETLSNDELIKNLEISLEIEHPDKKLENIQFTDAAENGVFKTIFKPTLDGIYSATVIVTSKTFQRQQFFSFKAEMPKEPPPKPEPVIEPVPEPEPEPEPEPAVEPKPEPEPVKPPVEKEAEPEPESDLVDALIIFIIGNLILIFIAANVFFVYRMIKNKKQATTIKDEEQETAE